MRRVGSRSLLVRLAALAVGLLELRSLIGNVGHALYGIGFGQLLHGGPAIVLTVLLFAGMAWLLRESSRGLTAFLLTSEVLVSVGLAGHLGPGHLLQGAGGAAGWLPFVVFSLVAIGGVYASLWSLFRSHAPPDGLFVRFVPVVGLEFRTVAAVAAARRFCGCRPVRGPPLCSVV